MQTKELKSKINDLLTKQRWYISINPTFGPTPNTNGFLGEKLKRVVWVPYIRFDGAKRVFYEHPSSVSRLKKAMVKYFKNEGIPDICPDVKLSEIKKGLEDDFYTIDAESSKQINKLLNKNEQYN